MAGRAGRFGVGDAMTAVALAAPVFAATRVAPALGAWVGVVLAMAWHRTRAVRRAEAAPELWAGTLDDRAAWWLSSVLCAVAVGLAVPFAALLAGIVGSMCAGGLVAAVTTRAGGNAAARIAALLGGGAGALAAGLVVARALFRGAWPGPDGRIPWEPRPVAALPPDEEATS
jgi:hypothetical protein